MFLEKVAIVEMDFLENNMHDSKLTKLLHQRTKNTLLLLTCQVYSEAEFEWQD